MSYRNNPEIIASVRSLKGSDDILYSDCVAGIEATGSDAAYPNGLIEIDIRGAMKVENLVVRLDAEQLMQAVTRAMLNKTK